MEEIIVTGGVRLKGSVKISGAKNAALPILAATILTSEKSRIKNVPKLEDIRTIYKLFKRLGIMVEEDGDRDREVVIDPSTLNSSEAPYDLVKTMRASCLVLGPLIARLGRARVSFPGGCAIGARPIDLHLKGLKSLGAEIGLESGYINASAQRLKGTNICLDIPTVTGTENIMMAAVLAEGETIIENPACEPEVVSLSEALNSMGASISGAGTRIIKIKGVTELKGMDYSIIPDRVEAGTFMVAAAITQGDIKIEDCIPEHVDHIIARLRDAGMFIEEGEDWVRVKGGHKIRAVDIRTSPYPGFPTDMQAQMMALMSLSDGLSVITETIFENRFMHALELKRMGADITIDGHSAVIRGVPSLSGAQVMATDLRASASLILAGLSAKGDTIISRIYHIDRGYECIEKKLEGLGAKIKRVRG
ncbi:MAG: UDP-N-acetylglucosamine 1-carboxyvinyltransferase [Nitrospinae bacterium]|nr:UDP-N-acetylglucosamine 1-carboxyvinyltransferase [Nitrospinota bacterium]